MAALDCVNQKDKALVACGDLLGASNGTSLTGLGRVTTETAEKAAEKHGCQVKAGERLSGLSAARLGASGTAKPLARAQGSCAALRGTDAAAAGTPEAMEYPADPDAPQTNCYLVTKAKKPGYGLYAYYGAAAKDFLASEGDQLEKGYGPTHGDRDLPALGAAGGVRAVPPARQGHRHLPGPALLRLVRPRRPARLRRPRGEAARLHRRTAGGLTAPSSTVAGGSPTRAPRPA
ncbi:hypothetical protein ACFY2H_27240 [Streptomyces griseofuscus]|uniref:hypothetical protein n=1 Tax=Streptomyces griseofuscus TaxID=146922 RepID=UPI00367C974F